MLAELNYRNLDELPAFAGRNTTTEFLARDDVRPHRRAHRRGELGPMRAPAGSTALRVALHESHVAWAAYEGPLPDAARRANDASPARCCCPAIR